MLGAEAKYRDVYAQGATNTQTNNYDANTGKYGDTVYETSTLYGDSNSWDGDYSSFPYTSYPVFIRGGRAHNGSLAGVFAFSSGSGNSYTDSSFRPVLVGQHSGTHLFRDKKSPKSREGRIFKENAE